MNSCVIYFSSYSFFSLLGQQRKLEVHTKLSFLHLGQQKRLKVISNLVGIKRMYRDIVGSPRAKLTKADKYLGTAIFAYAWGHKFIFFKETVSFMVAVLSIRTLSIIELGWKTTLTRKIGNLVMAKVN
ncbi:hypothetical protein L2E82_26037 [Cichorium intybus]|uniref:Uncharacterized protein n=1 Tax=Cichorium intybus TaxID=13427 RepID=A0ACB9E698_CICIN|nr:hypothetical protein L2E82_26037 [Cichorium intybus]